ncbi:uncharacterized protein [Panulirus ornatus]|uniref:uncharacterized protein isoform X1 n=1 Tax=Panulirus ornatus TaxID=150431 RepID=UPI003A8598D0
MFSCEVVYHGRRLVQGAQSSATLTALVDHILHPPTYLQTHSYVKRESERCQLVCDDEHIRVTTIRKDEGFESDTESSGSACDDPYCGTQDIKMINDHVLRLDQLISEDRESHTTSDETLSSATSSGAESEDDSPRTAGLSCPAPTTQQVEVNKTGSVNDMFLMSDILYCHVSPATPRVLVVVVKDPGTSQVLAHVFQCPNEDTARNLYAHYKEASNKYKLNRYRNSKRKPDVTQIGALRTHKTSIQKAISNAAAKLQSGSSLNRLEGGFRGSLRAWEAQVYVPDKQGHNDKNVNVIQIRDNESGSEEPQSWNPAQHTDVNGVTHIEVDSGPYSLINCCSTSEVNTLVGLNVTNSSPFSSSLNSVATRSHHRNDSLSLKSITGSDGVRGASSGGLVAGDLDRRSRQRQPPLLLRRDEFPHQDQCFKSDERRNEDNLGRNESKKEDVRREKKTRNECFQTGSSGRSRRDWHEGERGGLYEVSRPTVEAMIPRLTQPRPRDHSRARIRNSHNKGPAPPPPPPRRHPDNPALLLVPTKSGAETARAFYPKESHIVRGNKIVRVDAAASYRAGWLCHDDNRHQYYEYHATTLTPPTESIVTPEMRRRSRSKSPARRPMAHRYIDAVSTFSLSQKLKDISDAVFTGRRSSTLYDSQVVGDVRGHQGLGVGVVVDGEATLRPVIKKGGRHEGSPQVRRVTFSAYATVQVMEA